MYLYIEHTHTHTYTEIRHKFLVTLSIKKLIIYAAPLCMLSICIMYARISEQCARVPLFSENAGNAIQHIPAEQSNGVAIWHPITRTVYHSRTQSISIQSVRRRVSILDAHTQSTTPYFNSQ